MDNFQKYMLEYRKQMKQGVIPKAYSGLIKFMLDLRTHFKKKIPEFMVPGSIYQGYMDMTYFSIIPTALKEHQLKIAIVFLHKAFRFEVWLAGVNKAVQNKYWEFFRDNGWKKYPIVASTQGADAIIEHIMADNPDFGNLEALTQKIETGTLEFIREVKSFLGAFEI